MTLQIIYAPNPILTQVAKPVSVDQETKRLMEEMLETMYISNGCGLAAPQVGVSKRVIIVDVAEEGEKPNPFMMANPEIIEIIDPKLQSFNEGCLSFPGVYPPITRPRKVSVRYIDIKGKKQELIADGLLATCIQHEIDHLNGILITDHISKLKQDIIWRKMKKYPR